MKKVAVLAVAVVLFCAGRATACDLFNANAFVQQVAVAQPVVAVQQFHPVAVQQIQQVHPFAVSTVAVQQVNPVVAVQRVRVRNACVGGCGVAVQNVRARGVSRSVSRTRTILR